MISKAIKVKINDIEGTLKMLKEKDLLKHDLKIRKEGDYAYIPVEGDIPGFESIDVEFHEYKRIRSYRDLLDLPDELKGMLPTSYDRVGEVIIIKLQDELYPYAKEIGDAILNFHKNMKTVALDLGVKGELRVRNLRVISGDGLETVHRENGIKIAINPGEVYFSPRLSGERKRIMNKVKNGEKIIDMFCGAGPFSILIGKNRDVEIFAIDKNPKAIEYLRISMEMNRIKNVKPILGDVREVLNELPVSDRIIMDLPFYSIHFIEYALEKSRKGTNLHLYSITDDENAVLKTLENRFRIIDYGVVHGYSPRENMYFFDLEVK